MQKTISMLALGAALALGGSGAALAQVCPPGYVPQGGACYAAAGYGYSPPGPLSGAAAGAASGAAAGGAAAGPVGSVIGGALGTAAGAVTGAANAAGNIVGGAVGAPPPVAYGSSTPPAARGTCPPGLVLYEGSCYPDPNR